MANGDRSAESESPDSHPEFRTRSARWDGAGRQTAQRPTDEETQRRNLEILYRADEYLHRHLRLDQVLQALVDVVVDLLHADKASVQVWEPTTERLMVRAARGYSQAMIDLMCTYGPGDGIAGNVFLSGEPIAVEDARLAPPPADHIADVEAIRSVLSVPLTIGGRVYGVFAMDYCQPRAFDAEDRRLFMALAQRAAMAIHNAHLYEQAEQAAMLEERQRLARELHDSVSQTLYSLVLLAEAGRRFSDNDDLAQVSQILARLGDTSLQALREMRLMVYQLRPLALQETGLVSALQQRLDAVEKRAGIHAYLEVSGDLPLPGPWEEAFYRIAQEALNNALKHAGATTTNVTLRARRRGTAQTTVELRVSDDGRGFDITCNEANEGIGLASMRERAAQLGAALDIRSSVGAGTLIAVETSIPDALPAEKAAVKETE